MSSISFEIGQVDLNRHVAAGYVPGDPRSPNKPAYLFRREGKGDIWMVAATPISDPDLRWHEVRDGAVVMVPLVPYLVDPVPELILGFGVQLALGAAVAAPFPVAAACLALARPAEEVEVEGRRQFRIHLGLALRTR